MSMYTDYLNLFLWDPIADAEEEFDIEKAINENFQKIDLKLKNYIDSVNSTVKDFESSIEEMLSTFSSNFTEFQGSVNQEVGNLKELISKTQEEHYYRLDIIEDHIADNSEVEIPCFYKVRGKLYGSKIKWFSTCFSNRNSRRSL